MSHWHIFLLILLANSSLYFFFLSFFCIFTSLIIGMIRFGEIDTNNPPQLICNKIFNQLIITIFIVFILFTLSFLAPNEKQVIAIYAIPAIVNNKDIKQLPDDLHQWLLKEIKEDN